MYKYTKKKHMRSWYFCLSGFTFIRKAQTLFESHEFKMFYNHKEHKRIANFNYVDLSMKELEKRRKITKGHSDL